jgi:atypical dual specificity phosphatase
MANFLSQVAKITDHLYLSSFVGATDYNLTKFNISCIITVCKEVPKVEFKNIESVKLDVVDRPTESLAKYFDFVCDKINEVVNKKGVCLVHCVAGVSRSASMILAYLMKYHKMNLKDAHSFVKSKRPFVSCFINFINFYTEKNLILIINR